MWNFSERHDQELENSKKKYESVYPILLKTVSTYVEPEWGFPKGRRNIAEKNVDCAVREFYEETNYSLDNIHILERLNCLEEEYQGSNCIKYKHVYYIASSDNDDDNDNITLNLTDSKQLYEIGEIAWFTIPEALEKIRPYYESRINIIHQLYFFIINLVCELSKINKKSIEY
jgi:8-oxo-dGTP pyrophosphatase MutT (NUDIX family)